jgi:hypothetical protein
MGRILLPHHRTEDHPRGAWRHTLPRGCDPTAAARGILSALAVSALFWIALALLVPMMW